MKIEFTRDGKHLVDKAGHIVDRGLISAYKHQWITNNRGWVEIPDALLGNGDISPEVKLIGCHVEEEPTKDEMELEFEGGLLVAINGDEDHPSVKSFNDTHKIKPTAWGPASFIEPSPYAGKDGPYPTPTQISEDEEEELFGVSQHERINLATLQNMGFTYRKEGRWYHPVFGDDFEWNWMRFDPKTDSVSGLAPKLFRSGYVQGQRKVRLDIKSALDIR